MLKHCVIFTLIIYVVVRSVAVSRQDEQIIKDYMKNKCEKNRGPHAFEELSKGVYQFFRCFQIHLAPLRRTEGVIRRICTDLRPLLHSCFDIFFEKLESCLDEEEKYLPHFMSSWYNYTLDSHCGDDGDSFIEHIEDLKIISRYDNCTFPRRKDADAVLEKCFSKSEIMKDLQNPDYVITKVGLCRYLEHGNECLADIVRKSCDERLSDFIEHHLEPTKIWCDKYANITVGN